MEPDLKGWVRRWVGRRWVVLVSSIALAGLGLPGCTNGQHSVSSGSGVVELTSAGNDPSTVEQTRSTGAVLCSLGESPSNTNALRFSTPSSSTWWVTYAVVVNNCTSGIVLTGVVVGAAAQSNEGTADLGSAMAVPMVASAPPLLYTPGGEPLAGGVRLPFTLAPKSTVAISVRITLPELGAVPSRIPRLRLIYVPVGGQEQAMELNQELRFCACPPPSNPSSS